MPGQEHPRTAEAHTAQEKPTLLTGFNTERDPQRDWLPGESDFGPADFSAEDPGPETLWGWVRGEEEDVLGPPGGSKG